MPKPRAKDGRKNLIGVQLKKLRRETNMSTRDLATQLQLNGVDIDRNVINRIENNRRYVTDIEIREIAKVFEVTYEELIDGNERTDLHLEDKQ